MTPPAGRSRGAETPDPPRSDGPPPDEERAPIFGTWPRFYAAVILNLVVLVTLFYLFARAFR